MLEDIYNFNKDKSFKDHGYTNPCLITGGDFEAPWDQLLLCQLERAEDPLQGLHGKNIENKLKSYFIMCLQ